MHSQNLSPPSHSPLLFPPRVIISEGSLAKVTSRQQISQRHLKQRPGPPMQQTQFCPSHLSKRLFHILNHVPKGDDPTLACSSLEMLGLVITHGSITAEPWLLAMDCSPATPPTESIVFTPVTEGSDSHFSLSPGVLVPRSRLLTIGLKVMAKKDYSPHHSFPSECVSSLSLASGTCLLRLAISCYSLTLTVSLNMRSSWIPSKCGNRKINI
jgi:hypothetical protein